MKRENPGRLGDILITMGLLDREGLERALERQKMHPGRLGAHLLELGLVSERNLALALSSQSGLPPFTESPADVDEKLARHLPKSLAKKHRLAPVGWEERRGALTLAAAQMPRLDVLDEIRFARGAKRVEVLIAPERILDQLIAKIYEGIAPSAIRETTTTLAMEDFPFRGTGRTDQPKDKAQRKKGVAVVVDNDRKRLRLVSSLVESSGYSPLKAASLKDAEEALSIPGRRLWIHKTLLAEEKPEGALVYDDPGEALAEHLLYGPQLADEACALARQAFAVRGGGNEAKAGAEAASLVRLMGARTGLGPLALAIAEIKTWSSALEGFEPPTDPDSFPGGRLLEAVAVYFRELENGLDRQTAASAVRGNPSLDQAAATMLLRWALGADLLTRMDRAGKILVAGDGPEQTEIAAHLTRAGWEVERAPGYVEGSRDAILMALGAGLALLEGWAKTGSAPGMPVFLLSASPSGPDTMYALRLGAEDVFAPGAQPEVVEAKIQRAVQRAGLNKKASLNGDLSEMGFADLLQVLSNGSRTCVITIVTPETEGSVALKEGSVVDARVGNLKGVEAFYEMVAWTHGRFEIAAGMQPPEPTIEGESTEGLLMEGFRLLDERLK